MAKTLSRKALDARIAELTPVAVEALELTKQIALLEEQLKLRKDELATLPVGTAINTDAGRINIQARTTRVIDVDTLKANASAKVFGLLTKTDFNIGKYDAAIKVGLVPEDVQALLQTTVGKSFATTTVAK